MFKHIHGTVYTEISLCWYLLFVLFFPLEVWVTYMTLLVAHIVSPTEGG